MTQEQQLILIKANELLVLLGSVFEEIPFGTFFDQCVDVESVLIKLLKNSQSYQSADACRSPVQSADFVGQGSTSDLSVDSGN